MPLVNEVVIPIRDKDKFNASEPKDDAQFLKYVTNPELPKLIQAIYGIPAPAEPRNDLVSVFLTGVPGLNQPPNAAGARRDAAAQHLDRAVGRTRSGSVCSTATTPASRTAGALPTT